MNQKLSEIRKEYTKGQLALREVPLDPLELFNEWMSQAIEDEPFEPNAMVLSTADASGFPSSRVVLLKGIENRHFVFYTNHGSRKGKEIAENNKVSLLFFWPLAERQVRIAGITELIHWQDSEEYFATRPYESKIGALASLQSQPIPGRGWLMERFESLKREYPEGSDIPMPAFWGGYAVNPVKIEFWQGREARLHDRIEYTFTAGNWNRQRLSP